MAFNLYIQKRSWLVFKQREMDTFDLHIFVPSRHSLSCANALEMYMLNECTPTICVILAGQKSLKIKQRKIAGGTCDSFLDIKCKSTEPLLKPELLTFKPYVNDLFRFQPCVSHSQTTISSINRLYAHILILN